jgi:beta-phosphoglucomutase family hydrolase
MAGRPGYIHGVLGLPDHITACLFDLDGVLTDTARVHDAAWKHTFDSFLRAWAQRHGAPFQPFDPVEDYNSYVDGRPRADGVRTFLASRGITLPEGSPDDPPEAETVNGLGNRKNAEVQRRIHTEGVAVYPGSLAYLRAARDAGLRRAVVSASANCHDVLVVTGLIDLIEERVDGQVAAAQHLRGKPAPDTFLAGAARLGVPPAQAVVFEDAVAGVQAGRDGSFGYVVGVDRVGHADALRANGASTVVKDLADLLPADLKPEVPRDH